METVALQDSVGLLLYNSFALSNWADLIWLHFTSDYTLYNLLCDK